jgi:MinD-like ATPase involved in chromosome partitioning or flagellar assembly
MTRRCSVGADSKVRDAIRAQTPATRHPGSDAARDIEATAQQLAQALDEPRR